jgi:hypothetical protein
VRRQTLTWLFLYSAITSSNVFGSIASTGRGSAIPSHVALDAGRCPTGATGKRSGETLRRSAYVGARIYAYPVSSMFFLGIWIWPASLGGPFLFQDGE